MWILRFSTIDYCLFQGPIGVLLYFSVLLGSSEYFRVFFGTSPLLKSRLRSNNIIRPEEVCLFLLDLFCVRDCSHKTTKYRKWKALKITSFSLSIWQKQYQFGNEILSRSWKMSDETNLNFHWKLGWYQWSRSNQEMYHFFNFPFIWLYDGKSPYCFSIMKRTRKSEAVAKRWE